MGICLYLSLLSLHFWAPENMAKSLCASLLAFGILGVVAAAVRENVNLVGVTTKPEFKRAEGVLSSCEYLLLSLFIQYEKCF